MGSPSEDICCCGARTWSLVIGWLETIGSVISLVFMPVFYFMISLGVEDDLINRDNVLSASQKQSKEDALGLDFRLFAGTLIVASLFSLMELIAGIFLLQGVYQENIKKILAWKVFQIVVLVFLSIITFLALLSSGVAAIGLIFSTLVVIFCIWVVGIHREELCAGTGNSDFGSTNDLLKC